MFADTHCHLNHLDFDADRTDVVARAANAGVDLMVIVGYDLASSSTAVSLADPKRGMYATIGVHPESLSEWTESNQAKLQDILLQNRPVVVAWGEIGLDYHWNTASTETQIRVFAQQAYLATELGLPVVVHCRDAYADTLDVLQRQSVTRAVLHCFTGTADEAKRTVEAGFYLGIGGVATFKKSGTLRDAIGEVPLDNIVLETDCPYLAPGKWRGKRNEPAYITEVAKTLASVYGLSEPEIADATRQNALRLYGMPAEDVARTPNTV